MFRTFARRFLPSPLDRKLKKGAKRGSKRVFVTWNRGLGDIALGVFAVVHSIRKWLPQAKIIVLTREGLLEGFSMLKGIEVIGVPGWQRGDPLDPKFRPSLEASDLWIENPSPTDWCAWQHGTLTPKLQWNELHDPLWKRFDLSEEYTYIGVQISAETNYGFWRNWPLERWEELLQRLSKKGFVKVLLFGHGKEPLFSHPMVMDLRGKTTLFELLSIIQHRCKALVLPDSGILSMVYYLNRTFSIRLVSLWADPRHGVLKQRVASPNSKLQHIPLIGAHKNLETISAEQVEKALFPRVPLSPLRVCARGDPLLSSPVARCAILILAGGQGSRLGFKGPKGCFPILGKTLFEHHMERAEPGLPIYIMTSPLNHDETLRYLEQKQNFGREIYCFTQTTVPLLNFEYKEVGTGPDGNGSVYASLVQSGLLEQMEKRGIDTLVLCPIENPLAHATQRKLVAFHRAEKQEVTIQCIARNEGETMGVLVEQEGQLRIAEYFALEGQLLGTPSFSYMGQLAFSTSFIRKAAALSLPYHWVQKQGIWKREKLLFDAFEAASRIGALCFSRESCYAPIKSLEQLKQTEQALQI